MHFNEITARTKISEIISDNCAVFTYFNIRASILYTEKDVLHDIVIKNLKLITFFMFFTIFFIFILCFLFLFFNYKKSMINI